MAYTQRFEAPRRGRFMIDEDTQLQSFTLREQDGKDEELAAEAAKMRGSNMGEELVRLSVVEVNDQPVTQPYLALSKWSSRARGLVTAAWKAMNLVSDEEERDFLTANGAASLPDPAER